VIVVRCERSLIIRKCGPRLIHSNHEVIKQREGFIVEFCELVDCEDEDAPKIHFQELGTITKSKTMDITSIIEPKDNELPQFKYPFHFLTIDRIIKPLLPESKMGHIFACV
jgi:hypothetical protein